MAKVLRNLAKLDGAGRRVLGTPWRGYLGSAIPSGSAIYNDLSLPADNDKDYSLRVLTWPASGTLFLKEDGSPIFTPAADGTFTATAQLVENGIDIGSPETLTFNSGATATVISCAPGKSTASGMTATVSQGSTIIAAVSNNVAAGSAATVLQGTTISAASGSSIAAGTQATVLQGLTIAATAGNSAASSATAAVLQGNTIIAAAGIGTAAGVSASVSQGMTVSATAGNSASDGAQSVIGKGLMISAPRFARPISDVTNGIWLPSLGSSLAAMIDEPIADSSDYISATSAGTCEIALNAVVDPNTSSNQVVRYQAWAPSAGALTVQLKQGAAVIAIWTHATLPTTPTIFAHTLTGPQCDAITNYADLRFTFTAG